MHALAAINLRSVLGIGLAFVVVRSGTLKNSIIREVLNIKWLVLRIGNLSLRRLKAVPMHRLRQK